MGDDAAAGIRGGRVSAGAIGGAAAEAGSEYRRGVAAYAVTFGLVGTPMLGFGVPAVDAVPSVVSLEADEAVDDVVVEFTSGWVAFVQAKRRVIRGVALQAALEQWRDAGASGSLDPSKHRLVLVGGSISNDLKVLGDVLERHKRAVVGSLTGKEQQLLNELVDNLRPLDDEQIGTVLQCAVMHELDVEVTSSPAAREAVAALDRVVADASAVAAWDLLRGQVGRVAAQRSGDDVAGWVRSLRGVGIGVRRDSDTPAAEAARIADAMDRYRSRLIRDGERLDLRGLGAAVRTLDYDKSNAGINVHAEGDEDRRDGRDLLWAFLRRGRAVLTGLPGAGKSTSVRVLAADLCRLSVAPLPVRVSLRDADYRDRSSSLRDRLVESAISEDRPDDRPILREEINRRLDTGGVALLLDSLDETYERRGEVVGEIERMLAGLSADTDVLLVTRDVGYGQAATLGWPVLTQATPADVDRIVGAVVAAARDGGTPTTAKHDAPSGNGDDDAAVAWVRSAIAQHDVLQETPLMPVLLALQAAERPHARLPETRAATLVGLIKDVLGRFELRRGPEAPLGVLQGSQLSDGIMHAFAAEATAILNQGGQAEPEQTIACIADEVGRYWNLGPGDATAVARDALRFLDESGIFVMSGPSGEVSPRLALFAEIGAAWHVIHSSDVDLSAWATERLARGQIEALVLAALLDSSAASVFGEQAARSTDPAVISAAVRAHSEGAGFDDEHVEQLVDRVIDELSLGGQDGWDRLSDLLLLPLSDARRDAVMAAADAHDPSRAAVIRALLDLQTRTSAENREDPTRLLEVLELQHLPRLERQVPDGATELRISLLDDWRPDHSLVKAQEAAATELIGHVDAAIEPIRRLAGVGNRAHEPFRSLLRGRGLSFAEPDKPTITSDAFEKWMAGFPQDTHLKMLDAITAQARSRESAPSQLSLAQRYRLDELATFLETFEMNEGGSHHVFREPERLPDVLDLLTSLFGFDIDVLAAQAELVKFRVVEEKRGLDAFFALFDHAEPVSSGKADWAVVHDIPAAMQTLAYLQMSGRGHAWTAARALWNCRADPARSTAVEMLESQIELLGSNCDHLETVTHTLLAVTDGARSDALATHRHPSVREVAATWLDLAPDGTLLARHRDLLADDDGGVRVAALERAASLGPPDLAHVLDEAAGRSNPSWMCRHCCTVNAPAADRACSKKGCLFAGPDPRKRANELRVGLYAA